ncbi:MAG: leucyl/phenylalanyl-tRNA--protein transferase [Nocardioidaceae bacterium]
MPEPLAPSPWRFDASRWADDDCVAGGADLEPETLYDAYTHGAFPMPVDDVAPMLWWSPLRRGVLELPDLVVSRSLRRSLRDYEIRVDTAFEDVVRGCADPARSGSWINTEICTAYSRMHRLGWAHSVEAWRDDQLMGGLYGLAIGGLFAGESMFHRARDASKVALVALVDLLRDDQADDRLVDVQWSTDHLVAMGVSEISRARYLERLPRVLAAPLPQIWR